MIRSTILRIKLELALYRRRKYRHVQSERAARAHWKRQRQLHARDPLFGAKG